MKKVLFILLSSLLVISLIVGFLFAINLFDDNVVLDNEIDVNINEEVNNEPKLTCFELIDKQLVADGFTYLEDAKWGRGVNNNFIVDLVAQEVQISDARNAETVPAEWYKDYNSWVLWAYSYTDKKIYNMAYVVNGGSRNDEVSEVRYDPTDVSGSFYDFQYWMEYYINQTNKYGCSIENLTVEKLTGEYKILMSTTTQSDVVSVFDRKSEDSIIRYYNDVHVDKKIEDNPRYKELNTKEEYYALDGALNFESVYFINVLYKDPTPYTMFMDLNGVKASVIKEFVNDVVFTQTSWIGDIPNKETVGVYFIYVDNPNGEFKSMYTEPLLMGTKLNYSMTQFDTIETPFEGYIMLVNKGMGRDGRIYEMNPLDLMGSLKFYLELLQDYNPNFEYSEDFVTNYTRPFNKDWQEMVGLTKFFDDKYGYINHEVEYTRSK